MDNNPKGPYKYYERPKQGRSENEHPSGGKWGIVISILIIILVILIPTVHGLANKNIHHVEQAKEVQRVSSRKTQKRVKKHKVKKKAKSIKKAKKNKKIKQQSSSSVANVNSKKPSTYVVQDGDTLTSIAEKNGISASKLASLNNLDNSSSIDAGQTLKLK